MRRSSGDFSRANDLLFGAAVSAASVTSTGNGYTARSTDYGNMTEDRLGAAPGTYSLTGTQNGSAWAIQLVAFKSAGGPSDIIPPSVPTGLAASAVSSSQINLSRNESTGNVGVAGYQVFRNSTQIASTSAISYSDTGLASNTRYTYTVAAYDAAGNISSQSQPASTTTLAVGSPSCTASERNADYTPTQVLPIPPVPRQISPRPVIWWPLLPGATRRVPRLV